MADFLNFLRKARPSRPLPDYLGRGVRGTFEVSTQILGSVKIRELGAPGSFMGRGREDRDQKRYPKSSVPGHLRVTLSRHSRTPFLSPTPPQRGLRNLKNAGAQGKDGARKEMSTKLAIG